MNAFFGKLRALGRRPVDRAGDGPETGSDAGADAVAIASVCAVPGSGDLVWQIPLDAVVGTSLCKALEVWRAQAGSGSLPTRAKLMTQRTASFLRDASLIRLTDGDGGFEYRIAGDAVVEAWGQSPAGQDASGLDRMEDGAGSALRACCQMVLRAQGPVAVRGILSRKRRHITHECVLLPLASEAGAIESILMVTRFSNQLRRAAS